MRSREPLSPHANAMQGREVAEQITKRVRKDGPPTPNQSPKSWGLAEGTSPPSALFRPWKSYAGVDGGDVSNGDEAFLMWDGGGFLPSS